MLTERESVEVVRTQHTMTFNSSIAKVHQGQLMKETNPRDRAKTGSDGSDDPEGAGIKACGPKMNKAEAQLNRFQSSGDTGSSDRRADSVQQSRQAPGTAKHLERGEWRQRKDS